MKPNSNIHLASLYTALGQMPHLQTLKIISEYTQATGQRPFSPTYMSSTQSSIGAGLPPVPKKLGSRIKVREFIKMAELFRSVWELLEWRQVMTK